MDNNKLQPELDQLALILQREIQQNGPSDGAAMSTYVRGEIESMVAKKVAWKWLRRLLVKQILGEILSGIYRNGGRETGGG